jgi:hypothetical protein
VILSLPPLSVDLDSGAVQGPGVHRTLRPLERKLLGYLAEASPRVVGRDELVREVWGYSEGMLTRTVGVSVGRLRKAIEVDPSSPRYVFTVHGEGFALRMEPVVARPQFTGSFVGRAALLHRVAAWLASGGGRLLVVCGPPGVGKSRFVAELGVGRWVASDQLHEADGVALVDDLADRAAVLAALRARATLRVVATAAEPLELVAETVVALAPLEDADVERLVREAAGHLDDVAVRSVVEAAAGLPGVALEAIR